MPYPQGRAPTIGWRSNHADAVAEAVRAIILVRTKFNRPDFPPYRVRKRRSCNSYHILWMIYTPTGWIPKS